MPAITVPNGAFSVGPGYLYRAILATALPTNTVAASVFTDAWAAAWVPVGTTREGSTFTYQTEVEGIIVAEYLDPLSWRSTGRNIGYAFDMAQITTRSMALAMNGGTITTVSGTGATTLTSYEPPNVGAEVRTMLGWESEAGDERLIIRQALQAGEVSLNRQKAPNYASLPVNFRVEQPASAAPFTYFTAGTTRAPAA